MVDSKALTVGLGNIVVAAAEAAAAGAAADEIVAQVEDLSDRTRMWGMLDTLDNLKKGGRIGKAQQLMGSVLSIKPILDMSTGEVDEAASPGPARRACSGCGTRCWSSATTSRASG